MIVPADVMTLCIPQEEPIMQFYQVTFQYGETKAPGERNSFLCRDKQSFCCPKSTGERSTSLLVGVDWSSSLPEVLEQWQTAAGIAGQPSAVQELGASEWNDLLPAYMSEQHPGRALTQRLEELSMDITTLLEACPDIFLSSTEHRESVQALKDSCRKNLLPQLGEELERIFQPDAPKVFAGHPVHYTFAETFDTEAQLDILLTALRMAGRLRSRQLITLNTYNCQANDASLEKIYRFQQGGAVLLRLRETPSSQENRDEDWAKNLHTVLETVQRYRGSVLTIFSAPEKLYPVLETLIPSMPGIGFIQFHDVPVDRVSAAKYVRELARHEPLSCKATEAQVLPDGKKSFTRTEVRDAFLQWQKRALCTEVYPAYHAVVQEKREGVLQNDPVEELDGLVGLEDAKKVLHQAIDYSRAQKLYEKRGFPAERPGLHMVFTGNPGTAKTTVARLVGRICKQYGLLPTGEFLEVGRGDLVGRYAGHTAKCVAEVFQRAKGGVLFIDEAYSLLDDRRGLFGDEAINAIVQQMENVRSDTMVIFAGYPREMETFLNRNEGLRSRVSFQVAFPDYSEEDLWQILCGFLSRQQRELDAEATQWVRTLLRSAMKEDGFGNGRFVRLLMEKAMMRQASRLMRLPEKEITDGQIRLLTKDDFAFQPQPEKRQFSIGFACG